MPKPYQPRPDRYAAVLPVREAGAPPADWMVDFSRALIEVRGVGPGRHVSLLIDRLRVEIFVHGALAWSGRHGDYACLRTSAGACYLESEEMSPNLAPGDGLLALLEYLSTEEPRENILLDAAPVAWPAFYAKWRRHPAFRGRP